MGSLRDLETLALLEEPVRRELYLYVRDREGRVGRDEAAAAAGVSRSLAAFHLDRLAEAGLLDVDYERLTGRSGRGAGRPAKVYAVSGRRLEVSVPETRYGLAARLLAEALAARRPAERPEEAAARTGEEHGRRAARERAPARSGVDPARRVARALADHGFEPARRRGEIELRNCPFHELARERPDLACPMSRGFVRGLVGELAGGALVVEAADDAGGCCAVVRPPG